jgi:hypothetical protein
VGFPARTKRSTKSHETARTKLFSPLLFSSIVFNSIFHLLFTHWLKLLYLFEALMLIGGTVFGKPQVQQFGLLAFALTPGYQYRRVLLAA